MILGKWRLYDNCKYEFGDVKKMEITNLNKRLSSLNSKSEDIKHEKKMLLDDYNDLLHQVRKLGIISAASFFTWAVILQAFSHSKSPTVKALGGFLTPWCIIVFLVAFIPLLIKGYDSFINADNQYAKKFARKLDKLTLADRIDNLNMDIARLDSEMEKIKEDILSQGGEIQLTEQTAEKKQNQESDKQEDKKENLVSKENFSESQPTTTSSQVFETESDKKNEENVVKETQVEENVMEEEISFLDDEPIDDREFGDSVSAESKKNDVSDIFSGLDDLEFSDDDDDDDEFENSSALWEKEGKKV